MWFFKKKDSLLDNLSEEGKQVLRQEAGKQLTDKALNYRNLKNYEESLEFSKQAFEKFDYIPAASVHCNTLVYAGKPLEAIKWMEIIFEKLRNNGSVLNVVEIATNLIWLFRDYAKESEKAEAYLSIARKLALSIPDSRKSKIIISGLDIEEAILLKNKGEMVGAERLAKHRLEAVPDCYKAKTLLSELMNGQSKPTIYGWILASNETIGLDKAVEGVKLRIYRGMEEIYTSAATFAMLILVARTKDWNADFLFIKNNVGDEALMRISNTTQITEEHALSLHQILKPIGNHIDAREFVDFISEGSFLVEEA